MRKIKIKEKWKEKAGEKDIEVSLIEGLNALISAKDPKDMPRGLDKARMFNRLIKAFDEAKKSDELILEETDYSFLKKTIEEGIPAEWGRNDKMMSEVENFMSAENQTK